MKLIRPIAILATAAVLLASCLKGNEAMTTCIPRGDILIEAEYADNACDSKTILDNLNVLWCPGDKIMVYQGALASGIFTSTLSEISAKSSFTGSLTAMIGEQETAPEQREFWAVYPSDAALGCNGTSVTVAVSETQQALEGGFSPGAFPSVAKSNSYAMGFYNICGGIKFTVVQSGIKKVVLRGANDEVLAGKVQVSFFEGYPVVDNIVSGVDSIVVNAPDAEGFKPGKEYFIVSLPAELPNGFSLTYTNDYGSTCFASSSSVSIKRRIFAVLEGKDHCGILFRDKVAKAACVAMFDTNGDGEVSFEEAKVAVALDGLFENYDDVQYFPELKYFTSVRNLKGCFSDCVNLKEQEIPSFITTLGEKSFYGCSSLSNIVIPPSIKYISDEAFRNCTSLKSIRFNEGLESLGTRAFYNIRTIELTLPASLKSIGNKALGNETSRIFMLGTVPPTLATVSFGTSTMFFVPDEALSAYKSAKGWSEFEKYIYPMSEYVGSIVDLGLSVKWRSWNVGATSPEEYGTYFAWGDVIGQTWNGSSWSGGGFSTNPTYELDANGNLKPEYDAAHVNLGGGWRMPTTEEQQELKDNCTSIWTSDYEGTGVAGRIFTSNKIGFTDKSIFLPAGGYGHYDYLYNAGSSGNYWSSTFYYDYACAWILRFDKVNVTKNLNDCYCGQFIRPVSE